MSLITEDGTGRPDAESYTSVAEADAYHNLRGNSLWSTITTEEKEQALRRGTDFLSETYRPLWKGYRLNGVQTLDWPRTFVYLEAFVHGAVGTYPYLVASDIVPREVKNACCLMALKAAGGELSPDLKQGIKSKTVGPIKTEYDQYSPRLPRYTAIDNMLRPFLKISGASVGLSRV
jgi:hypothetical protein